MKDYLTAVQRGTVAFWHALRGHPLSNARDEHQAAVRLLYRAHAEVAYHSQLADYFDEQARGMDPHTDWHLFAQLKDKWQEHQDERRIENRRFDQASAKVEACDNRLRSIDFAIRMKE